MYDDAALLSDEEQQSLSEEITNLQETTGWEVYVLTTEDAQGKTAREYADDFYDTTATGDDGVVFLIDMDNREVTISTAGEAIYYLNDDRIDDILDNGYDYVVDGEYASCFSSMLSDAEYYYEVGVPSDAYTYDEETGEIHYYHVLTLGEILFAVVLAAAVFAAVFLELPENTVWNLAVDTSMITMRSEKLTWPVRKTVLSTRWWRIGGSRPIVEAVVAAAIPADRRYIPAVLAEVMEAEAASSKYQKFGEQETKI